MAMAKCRECGKDVSSKAKTCPNCGVKRPSGRMSKFAILVLLLGGAVAVDAAYRADHPSPEAVCEEGLRAKLPASDTFASNAPTSFGTRTA
jgi:hypothetical protein